jgi:tetratricopeptide (TPR) repeat protein
MQKRINIKFLAMALVALAVFSVGWRFLHAWQVRRATPRLLALADAEERLAEPRLERIALFLHRYLEQNPADPELNKVRIRYGDLLIKLAGLSRSTQTLQQGLQVYEGALAEDATLDNMRLKLAKMRIRQQQFALAQSQLMILHDRYAGRNTSEVDLLLAQCLETGDTDKEKEEAQKRYRMSISADPKQIEAYVRLAALQQRNKERDECIKTLDSLVERNPERAEAYLERAVEFRNRVAEGSSPRSNNDDISNAARDVAKALQLAPSDVRVLLAAGETAQLEQKLPPDKPRTLPEKPEVYFQRALEKGSSDKRPYQALALSELRQNHPDEAIKWLDMGLSKIHDRDGKRDLRWSLALAHLEKGDLEAAGKDIKDLQARNLWPPQLHFLQGYIEFKSGHWLEASRHLEEAQELLRTELASRLDALLADCYGRLGETEKEIKVYRDQLKRDKDSVNLQLALVSRLQDLGRPNEALAECERMMKQQGAPAQGLLLLAQLMLNQRPAKGNEAYWANLTGLAEAAERGLKDMPEPLLLRADIAFLHDGDTAKARKILEQARTRFPKSSRPWVALADLCFLEKNRAEVQKGIQEAKKLLDEAEKTLGGDVALALARVNLAQRAGGKDAEAMLSAVVKGLPGVTKQEERLPLLRALADGYYSLGNLMEARRWWSEIVERMPGEIRLRLITSDLSMRLDDERGMDADISAVRSGEGTAGPLTRYLLARRLLWQTTKQSDGRLDQARLNEIEEHLTAAERDMPSLQGRVAMTRGQVSELLDKDEAALVHYQQAIKLGEMSETSIERTVDLLTKAHRYIDANKIFEEVAKRVRLNSNLQRLQGNISFRVAEASLEARNLYMAMRAAERAVAANPNNYRAHLLLGRILAGRGEPAEKELRRAIELNEREPDGWVALIHYFKRLGQKDKAMEVLQQAEKSFAKDKAPLALAECWQVLEEPEKAKQSYREALAQAPRDPATLRYAAEFYLAQGMPREAVELLRRLMAENEHAEDSKWARCRCAVVLAATGNFAEKGQALELVNLAVVEDGSARPSEDARDLEEQQAQAMVLATRPDYATRSRAITLFENLASRIPLTLNEQLVLAQLYELTGNWSRARDQMLTALGNNNNDPACMAAYANSLLRRNQLGDAQNYIDRLEQVDPASFATSELRARLLAARDQHPRAVSLLESLADKAVTPAMDPAEKLDRIGALLDDFSEVYPSAKRAYQAAADAVYVRLVKEFQSKRPTTELTLAFHLGKQGQVAQAIERCEKAARSCPPDAVANAMLAILHFGPAAETDYQSVDQWLTEAIFKYPKSLDVQICQADLNDVRGRLDTAKAHYRQILANDPKSYFALNNLAWLLAHVSQTALEAVDLIGRAIEIVGPHAELLDTKAVALFTSGQIEKAISIWEDITKDPTVNRGTLAMVHFHLAWAYEAQGLVRRAENQMQEAERKGLNPARIHRLEQPVYEKLVKLIKPGETS